MYEVITNESILCHFNCIPIGFLLLSKNECFIVVLLNFQLLAMMIIDTVPVDMI